MSVCLGPIDAPTADEHDAQSYRRDVGDTLINALSFCASSFLLTLTPSLVITSLKMTCLRITSETLQIDYPSGTKLVDWRSAS